MKSCRPIGDTEGLRILPSPHTAAQLVGRAAHADSAHSGDGGVHPLLRRAHPQQQPPQGPCPQDSGHSTQARGHLPEKGGVRLPSQDGALSNYCNWVSKALQQMAN